MYIRYKIALAYSVIIDCVFNTNIHIIGTKLFPRYTFLI